MDGPVWLTHDQAVILQSPEHLGDGGLGDPKPVREINGSSRALRIDQIGNQFDVILDQLGLVSMTYGGVLARLLVGRGDSRAIRQISSILS